MRTLRGRIVAALFLSALATACREKPAKTVDDDNSKAFAELEKNDRDDSGKPPAKAGGEDKPRGPVDPAPFTAEQIRDATKTGRTYRFRLEVPNKPAREYVITFRNVDDGGTELHYGGDQAKRLGWLALQQQAEFPK